MEDKTPNSGMKTVDFVFEDSRELESAKGASHASPGQRPGYVASPSFQALKGRPNSMAKYAAPTGLASMGHSFPGALPQADISRAFGPEDSNAQTATLRIEPPSLKKGGDE